MKKKTPKAITATKSVYIASQPVSEQTNIFKDTKQQDMFVK